MEVVTVDSAGPIHVRASQTVATIERINTMLNVIRQFVKEEEGVAAAEYAILLTLIALALTVAVTGLETAISGAFTRAAGIINPS
jgi:pilus assembly protein Flp/PilA